MMPSPKVIESAPEPTNGDGMADNGDGVGGLVCSFVGMGVGGPVGLVVGIPVSAVRTNETSSI
jgi:hypothetical protein